MQPFRGSIAISGIISLSKQIWHWFSQVRKHLGSLL